jgi:hypothetical protein
MDEMIRKADELIAKQRELIGSLEQQLRNPIEDDPQEAYLELLAR